MNEDQVVPAVFGSVFIALLLWHETMWILRLRFWKRFEGVVVRMVYGEDAEYPFPEIRFNMDGEERTFVSNVVSGWGPDLGDQVGVLCHPGSGKLVAVSGPLRWIPTGVICFFLLFVVVAFVANGN